MKAFPLPTIVVFLLIGVCMRAFSLPQRVYNRIDYPVGVKLRLKRITPKPPIPDTIQVVGYDRDKVEYRILSTYEPLNIHSGIHSNDVLHGYYLPLR
ncbi:hypothetical protein CLV58_115123 [Spirosoma oryzae]|uniref:Uncharacterized protein n=1 Tax=Spirosoma oryzae TaxID=1469603 RepID=A0A2T0SNQ2_9BACT|nr:hypothetical protein [Spirosoma oryzae]PRY35040.1 hypothetical protein CLV58_115123 [Spirosoma oryzae]